MADQDRLQAVDQPGRTARPGGQGGESDERGGHDGALGSGAASATARPRAFDEEWTMPRAPLWRRPGVVTAVAAGLVVMVLVGLLVWPGGGPGGDRVDRAAYRAALDRLAAAPVVRYTARPSGGAEGEWRLAVVVDGSARGTVAVEGRNLDVLAVDGRTYLRAVTGAVAAVGLDLPEDLVLDRWITGGAVDDAAPPPPPSPEALADGLRAALAQTDDLSGDDLAEEVGGRPAAGVRTPQGELYISRRRPHEVLRFVPREGRADPEQLTALGAFDVEVVRPGDRSAVDDVTATYDELTAAIGQLGTAVDADARLSVAGVAGVSCLGSCVVTAIVGTAGPAATAELVASVSVDGAPAGSCTSLPTPVPADGTGVLTCASPDAGARAAATLAQKQAAAGPFGAFATVDATASARVLARALDAARVDELVQALGRARAQAGGEPVSRR